jgi:hypothetical protein
MLKNINKFKNIYKPKKSIIVFNGSTPRFTGNGVEIIPYMEFIDLLWQGKIIDK